ncbi:MAG: serine O-acetyltransferase, partial [Bacteroidota bacterium]
MQTENTYLQRLTSLPLEVVGEVPDTNRGERFLGNLKKRLFPTGTRPGKQDEECYWECVEEELVELLRPVLASPKEVSENMGIFLQKIPELYARIMEDARMLTRFDPAAHSLAEVVHFYPGFQAIFVYRLAHQLYQQQVPVLPRMLAEIAHAQTGIDIHPGATIGKSFFIDHGTGIVIGETTKIGDRVRIYQG